jgi:hypothetical protein
MTQAEKRLKTRAIGDRRSGVKRSIVTGIFRANFSSIQLVIIREMYAQRNNKPSGGAANRASAPRDSLARQENRFGD